MNREIYTYTDLTKLARSKNGQELKKFPFITSTSDLRKSLNGTMEQDGVTGLFAGESGFSATDIHTIGNAIDLQWDTDQSKFQQMTVLSAFLREKRDVVAEDEKNWLRGCQRNVSSMLSAITMLVQADVEPEDMPETDDKTMSLFLEAWEYLRANEPSIKRFCGRMSGMTTRDAWVPVFQDAFGINLQNGTDTVVLFGFSYITPYQEWIMQLLEKAGFRLIFLIPYDERYPYVYEIWNQTYSEERGYPSKAEWHMEKADGFDPYGAVFEGQIVEVKNQLTLCEYASVTEFVNEVKHIREAGATIYSADHRATNDMLRDYFPEEYGERKILSYPVGQFISTLNRMWDSAEQTIILKEEDLIECFSSGWLTVDGIAGKEHLQSLVDILPFFHGCQKIDEWKERIKYFSKLQTEVMDVFQQETDMEPSVARWQEMAGRPLKKFGAFSVDTEKVELIMKLIEQLLVMAKELFAQEEVVSIQEHIKALDRILKKQEISYELYEEERALIDDIFEKLGETAEFDLKCDPEDIARALDLFLYGKMDEGEIRSQKVGMIQPMYLLEAACVRPGHKVHICMSDVDHLPGKKRYYIWPLTEKIVKDIYDRTKNTLLLDLMHVMDANVLYNRYYTYCALKNKDVTLSWISNVRETLLAPSPYIKLLLGSTNATLKPAERDLITMDRVVETPESIGRVKAYDRKQAPAGMLKEAQMDYAVCPMRYVLGYVVDKYPVFHSEFQQQYAVNALISAIYHLMRDQGMTEDKVYENVIELFPQLRNVEKRQVYDYIANDRNDNSMEYDRTECGQNSYTDERLKLHWPNRKARKIALERFGKLYTPDGRRDMDLYKVQEEIDICTFCPHVDYCRNAVYAMDQEAYYD